MDNNPILQVGVKILIENDKGQYLLLRRSLEKYPEIEGRWDIVGGRINPGKSLIENLAREVFEETGLKLIGTPKLIAAQDIFRKAGHHIVRLTYVGSADGEMVLDTSENDLYEWHAREELAQLNDMDVYLKELFRTKSFWGDR